MSADSPRHSSSSGSRGVMGMPAIVPPQVVSDRSILDSAIGFINEVTLAHQPPLDTKDTITWARFETTADVSDSRFGDDWELDGNVAPPLLLILGYGLGVQVWAIPANGEAVEVLSWRHGIVSALRVLPSPLSTIADEENGRADEPIDAFVDKRPLIALVDGSATSGPQPQFCAVNFISLKTGAQVKAIKFKNPVIDILANRSSVVITFHERIAVFDARTLEDRLSITTCYPSPGINPNPVALGPRWLAYAENKLLHTKRSAGGCDGDGVASYTATVLNASKSLVKGLRELGEQVAAGLTGTSGSVGNTKNISFDSSCGLDTKQAGIVTIIDVKNPLRDYSPTSGISTSNNQAAGTDTMIAHFIAHSEALVAMEFDNSGMILVTADRRGHDFHVFRIQPNPVGSALAAVHHLYILHRGDTSAKVQNITLTLDSRWVAVSTLRGTTHVFPITPYGGTMGVRTHTSLHVVNKLSRFHRSAGLSGEGRSNSPISHSESTTFSQSLQPYYNSTLPPFPRPTIVLPLAQLRQPFALGSPPGSASLAGVKSVAGVSGSGTQRQRLSSLSDDSGKPLSVCAIFAKSRSWLLDPPNVTREATHRMQRKAVDSLFVMAGHGALIQYDLGTKLASNVAKEKICDDTPIELEVEAKAQWNLGRRKEGSVEVMPPLTPDNWLIKKRNSCMLTDSARQCDDSDERCESWLAQVEIITHAGPHRRLWMGPQFVFKTYNSPSGSNLNHVDIEAVEIGTIKPGSTSSSSEKLDHSSPLNMPLTSAGRSGVVPVLIESGSYSSIEQSPKLMDRFRHDHLDSDYSVAHGDSRLKEDLADAMRESPSSAVSSKDAGGHVCESGGSNDNVAFYDALAAEDDQVYVLAHLTSAAALANVLPNIHSYDNSSSYESLDIAKKQKGSIEKIVNPLGTVTTITSCLTADVKTDILDEVVSQLAAQDTIIHENCDESLFRPVVAIFCDEKTLLENKEEARRNSEKYQPPETISSKLVVPVIAKDLNDELSKREKEKNSAIKSKITIFPKTIVKEGKNFDELSLLNKKPRGEKECRKTNNEILNSCTGEQVAENKFEKYRSEAQDSELYANIPEKKENLCLKTAVVPKQISAELKVTCKKRTETEQNIQEKNTKKLYEQATPQTIQQEIELRNNTKVRNEPDKEENIRDATKIAVNEKSAGSESTVSISCNLYKKEIINSVTLDENVGIKLESRHTTTSRNSNNSNTAIKEKLKKTKDCIKSNKLYTSDNTDNQFNVQKLADDPVKMEKPEEKFEYNERRESKPKSNKVEYEKIDLTKNPLACERKRKFKSKLSSENIVDDFAIANDESQCISTNSSKVNIASKTQENDGTCKKDNSFTERSNDASNSNNRVQEKREETSKGKHFLYKEQLVTKYDVSANLDLDLPIHKKIVVNDNKAKDLKSDFESLNPKNEDKSRKTRGVDKAIKKTVGTDSMKPKEEICEKNIQVTSFGEIDKIEKITYQNKKLNSLVVESNHEILGKELDNNNEEKGKIENKTKTEIEKSVKSETKDKTISCNIVDLSTNEKKLCKEDITIQMKKDRNIEVKRKSCVNEMRNANKDFSKNEVSCLKPNGKSPENETKKITLSPGSPKKKENETPKLEMKNNAVISKKISNQTILDKESEENKERYEIKENVKGDKAKSMNETNEKDLSETMSRICEKASKVEKKLPCPDLPPASAWKTLSGADMINKNLSKSDIDCNKFPMLGAKNKINNSDKLLPEIPTPADIERQTNLDEFTAQKTLDTLPPLPALEPLKLITENSISSSRDISLITFESPSLEKPLMKRRITPTNHGFTEQNLILALCGSLHYENEHVEKSEVSPTFSLNYPSTAFEDTSLADYKSLTENDDPYVSLDQSSQDTNTANTNTTNEKFLSSTNSSGSEEIVILEEKKITKKQKRKKQQQLKELQTQKDTNHQHEIDDEELIPLIAMTDSQIDQATNSSNETFPTLISTFKENPKSLQTQLLTYSTTTDSEGPLPATTSDDNVFSIPVPLVHNPQKIKTKKLEHKINLIAAIEAATSSSTSSAEESGIELGGRCSLENGEPLISEVNSISTSLIQLPIAATIQTTAGASKKKTKRRKR